MSLFLLVTVVFIALCTDVRSMTIPNWLTVGGGMLGLGWHCLTQQWGGLAVSAIGLAAGFGAVWVLYVVGAVGAGDVKLFAAIGAISGAGFALATLMYAILIAAGIGLLVLALRKRLVSTVTDIAAASFAIFQLRELTVLRRWKAGDALRFPFMLAVAPGAVLAFVMTPNG